MPRYLTPTRYRNMGLGVDLSSRTDNDLEALIQSASALANTFCAAPDGHDFRGGSVTNESHDWDVGNMPYRVPSGKIFPLHSPLIDVSELRIDITTNQTVTMTGAPLYVNPSGGYVQPIGTYVTTMGAPVEGSFPNLGLQPPVAYIDYTYGWEFTSTNERLYGNGKVYTAANPFWTADPPTVEINGTPTVAFSHDAEEGTITFDDMPDSSDDIRATYSYTLPAAISRAVGIMTSDMLGYSNINASGLSGLSAIRVEEIEMRQSSRAGFVAVPVSTAAQALLAPYRYISMH